MIKAYQINRLESYESQRGAEVARKRGYVPHMAAFLVNLDKPTENPQHKDLIAAEEFLIGYYEALLDDMKQRVKEIESRERTAIARAQKAEEVLDAYKSRSNGSRVTITKNRRPAGRNSRRN